VIGMANPQTPERPLRADAERNRLRILAAAEQLFAERGYDAASLQDIGAAAGLSRGTPSYFFGSKERLHLDVLRRAFDRRHDATAAAFAPVRAWCEAGGGAEELREALGQAADGYMAYLAGDPAFVRLVLREELAGGRHLRALGGTSTAMEDAFGAVRGVASDRGLRDFAVADAVFLFVALTFTPFAYGSTFMRSLGRDLSRPAERRRQRDLAVGHLMALLGG
jgi:TetR/AcrR family transcriptional regulator